MRKFTRLITYIICLILFLQLFHIFILNHKFSSINSASEKIFKKFFPNERLIQKLQTLTCKNELQKFENAPDQLIMNYCDKFDSEFVHKTFKAKIDVTKLDEYSSQKFLNITFFGYSCAGFCKNIAQELMVLYNDNCYCISEFLREKLLTDKDGIEVTMQKTGAHKIYRNYEKPIESEATARIGYIMMLNGRDILSVFLLFRRIYTKNNYYFIHVDKRQTFLRSYAERLSKKYSNVYLFNWSISTIWGGASLLKAYHKAMIDIVNRNLKWDFLINLSESDYLLREPISLAKFLGANLKKNFVKSTGSTINDFINRQGLRKVFVECDNFLYLVGDRNLPQNVVVDGGSDWFVLNREFVHYLVETTDNLVNGLFQYFENALLPAETFFHTVLQNSRFCHSVVNGNLRHVNWNRKRGCRCQHSSVIGWCGCSPVVVRSKDWPRLNNLMEYDDSLYFVRKFDRTIDSSVFDLIEPQSTTNLASCIPAKHIKNIYSSWQDGMNDSYRKLIVSLIYVVKSRINEDKLCGTELEGLTDAELHMFLLINSTIAASRDVRIIAEMPNQIGLIADVTYIGKAGSTNFLNNLPDSPESRSWKVTDIKVSQQYDSKENVFAIPSHLMTQDDSFTLEVLIHSNIFANSDTHKHHSISLYVAFTDPHKTVHSFKLPDTTLDPELFRKGTVVNAWPISVSDFHVWYQGFEIPRPFTPGQWTVVLYSDSRFQHHLAFTWFLINPHLDSLKFWRVRRFHLYSQTSSSLWSNECNRSTGYQNTKLNFNVCFPVRNMFDFVLP